MAATRAALRNLDALVMAPIRDRLAGISHVILSPDGKLNLAPFEALFDPQGHYALEQRLVSYVTSGRDLLRLAARPAPRSPATTVADSDYGPGKLFARLAGMSTESQEVAGYLRDARTLTGAQATKAALARVADPAVLHIATHGFYARGPATSAPPVEAERGMFVDATALPSPAPDEEPVDALDRSGLALRGANSQHDGSVSARELASYDLWGLNWWCCRRARLGVGAVRSGEGVYDMHRVLVLPAAHPRW